jgi:serine/threonine-protein kinase
MPPSLPPDVLDAIRAAVGAQYEIDRILGTGGMGSVLLAHDRTLERPVAIKVIHPELAATASFRQRFLQEARTIAKLRHGSIVGVHAAGEAAGVLYFVMELVPGESLRDALARDGPMTPQRAAAILRDLADALAYAHRNGVVHRDIKPENILLDADTGRARLTDFGISRSLAAAGDRMTGTGMSMGTPAYMSPEQAAGERDVDGRSDLYALGLVGYEMLSGAPPFIGKSPASVVMKQITEQPAPLVGRVAGVPQPLAAIIEKALAKDPDDRWADGDSMARAIDAFIAGEDVPGLGAAGVTPRGGERAPASTGDIRGRGIASWRRRPMLAAIWAVALLLVPVVWVLASGGSGVPKGVDPRKSFLIIPFRVPPGDQSLAWLRDGSVSMLALNLAQWRDVSVVEYERSLDLLRDADLDGPEPISLAQARDLARRAGAWTVVMGEVSNQGDSLVATANLYAVESDTRIDQRTASVAASVDPRRLFDQLAVSLLGLVGAPRLELELAKTTTGSIEAYRHYLEGVRALNEWRLNDADSSLALPSQPTRPSRSPGTSARWRAAGVERATPPRRCTRGWR